MSAPLTNLERRQRRLGWSASSWLHGSVLASLFGCYLAGIELPLLSPPPQGKHQIHIAARWQPTEEAETAVRIARDLQVAEDLDAAPVDLVLAEIARPASPEPPAEAAKDTSVLGDFIRDRITKSVEEAQSQPRDEQEQRLKQLGDKLAELSSPESTDQITNSIQRALGAEKRATRPAEKPVDGDFDFASAQLHDARREPTPTGFRYTLVLLDSAGRTYETPVDQAEGEGIYRVFEIVKSNPLLEKLYRGVVMSMLDKILKPAAAPAKE